MLPSDLPRSPWLIVRGLAGLVGALASLPSALAPFHWAAQYDRQVAGR